jgi:hypothetical protein
MSATSLSPSASGQLESLVELDDLVLEAVRRHVALSAGGDAAVLLP